MRTILVGSLLIAAILTGCEGSGEQHRDYVNMGTHNDMDVSVSNVNAPAKALYPPAGTAGAQAPASSEASK